MTDTKELDDVIMELDIAASDAQTKSGAVSWRVVRAIAFKLASLTIGKVLIPKGSHAYLQDHHQITSSGVGLAKMALLRNNPTKAMEYLQKISAEIDAAVIKHLPEHHAALQELKVGNKETGHACSNVE